jgi:hypothetical protein
MYSVLQKSILDQVNCVSEKASPARVMDSLTSSWNDSGVSAGLLDQFSAQQEAPGWNTPLARPCAKHIDGP